jgi:CMP-N,N'-diacetyllegionaminic acid synthase
LKPLVVIPARGGSKSIPRKNIKFLNGKPLIQYTLETARALFADSQICLSTDDQEIKSVVENLGLSVPFIRPDHLASDTAGTYEVLLHALEFYENKAYYPDTLILLQATSPFRSVHHLKEAIDLFDSTCDMVVSVKETKSNPYFVLREENEEGWLVRFKEGNFIRRQDCPKVFQLNGAIYIINVLALKSRKLQDFTNVRKYLMDEMSSHDIDDSLDWIVAELLMKMMDK